MDFLKHDFLRHVDMIELLEMPDSSILYEGNDGALLYRDAMFSISCIPCAAKELLRRLIAHLPAQGDCYVVLHNPELKAPLLQEHGFHCLMDCFQCCYEQPVPVSYALPRGAVIRPLETRHLDFVHAHYRTVDDADYVRERIEAGMFGVFYGETPAGFIGTHDERSIGMLEVLPNYRKRGLAFALEAHMINHLLVLGRRAFCQVSVDNAASIALQKKLGMSVSDSVISWIERT
jgi:tRNA (guanine37-N1)-methyltransferase